MSMVVKIEKKNKGTYRGPKQRVKSIIRNRDKVCTVCGSDLNLTVDHITPHVLGGRGTQGNLRLLCQDCHNDKENPDARELSAIGNLKEWVSSHRTKA